MRSPSLPDGREMGSLFRGMPGSRGGEDWSTLSFSANAWHSHLFHIPNWIPVVVAMLLGLAAAVALAVRRVPAWPALLLGAAYATLHGVLVVFLSLDGGSSEAMRVTSSGPGIGSVFATLAFGNMTVAAWLLARQDRERSRPTPARSPGRRKATGPRRSARRTPARRRPGRAR